MSDTMPEGPRHPLHEPYRLIERMMAKCSYATRFWDDYIEKASLGCLTAETTSIRCDQMNKVKRGAQFRAYNETHITALRWAEKALFQILDLNLDNCDAKHLLAKSEFQPDLTNPFPEKP